MERPDPKVVLWENVRSLMHYRYGTENLTRFAKDVGMSPGNASRIKACQTSIGLDLLEEIAREFEIDPWMLLVPGMDPGNKPVLQPVTREERDLWNRLRADMAKLAAMQQRRN